MRKTEIFIDPGHSNWILGGLVREVSEIDPVFFFKPTAISNIRSKFIFSTIIKVIRVLICRNPILFSSLTPLENFLKITKLSINKKAVMFTHHEGELTKKDLKILHRVDLIFVFSSNDKSRLENLGIIRTIVVLTGAINPELFSSPVRPGNKIVYIGTAVERKNPKYFLDFAELNPNIEFKILGKDWKKSILWKELDKFSNIEYSEITGPITSKELDFCSHYLMLSRVEGGPMTLIESVAAGLIPISTKTGIAPDFLLQVGYFDQLIEIPPSFDQIKSKLDNKYSKNQVELASVIAKEYSLERLSQVIKSEIYANLIDFESSKL